MRILFCNKYNFQFSGTEVYMFSLMQLLRDHGHETALFAMADPRGQKRPYDEHFVPRVDFKNSKGLLKRSSLALHAIYSIEAQRRLRGIIADFKPDVAHVRNIYHHLSPSILWELKAQGIPVVYHLNDFKLLCPSYNLVCGGKACEACAGGRFWKVIVKGCYGNRAESVVLAAEAYVHRWLRTYERCVTRFVAPSQFVKDKLVEYGWDQTKIVVLPHFQQVADIPRTAPAPGSYILYFGRLSSEKGLPELILAMRRLPQVHLGIAGDGPQRQELEALVKELKLANVEFLGHVQGERLAGLIADSAFTVLPSRAYETLGKTILESYAQQRAVIASDLGSRRELVDHGKSGLLFTPGDVTHLAEAISFLYERPDLAASMGKAGYERVQRLHSPEQHYRQMVRIYQDVQSRATSSIRKRRTSLKIGFIGGRGVISRYSGIEAYYEEVGKRLASRGHEVTAYCRNYFTPDFPTHAGMRLVRLSTIRSKHLDTVVHTLLSSLHVLFTRADIVHYHALGPALFSWIPRLAGKKTVVTVQGLDWQRKKWGRVASSVLRLGERAAIQFPNRTMVVSQALQQHFRSAYGCETSYVPNGTELRSRISSGRLADWDLAPDEYILFLGRFSPEKNCHLLIQAFEEANLPAKLVLAGGSSYSDHYIESLRAHESNRVRLLNYVSGDALQELLTNAMLFVLPSDMEGLSLALLDAMGAGVCVLASDIPENIELVNGAGFTFAHGDVADLTRMLQLLVCNPDLRAEAAQRARLHIAAHYLWDEIACKIEAEYLSILGIEAEPVPSPAPTETVPESEPAA